MRRSKVAPLAKPSAFQMTREATLCTCPKRNEKRSLCESLHGQTHLCGMEQWDVVGMPPSCGRRVKHPRIESRNSHVVCRHVAFLVAWLMEVCNKLQDDPRDSRSAVANRRQKAVPSPPEGSFVTWPFAKMQTPTTARPLAWLRALAIQVSSKVFSSSVLRSKTIRFWSPSSKPSSFSGAPSGTEFFGPDGVAKGRVCSYHAEHAFSELWLGLGNACTANSRVLAELPLDATKIAERFPPTRTASSFTAAINPGAEEEPEPASPTTEVDFEAIFRRAAWEEVRDGNPTRNAEDSHFSRSLRDKCTAAKHCFC